MLAIDTVFLCEDKIILANIMNLRAHIMEKIINLVSTLYEKCVVLRSATPFLLRSPL